MRNIVMKQAKIFVLTFTMLELLDCMHLLNSWYIVAMMGGTTNRMKNVEKMMAMG